MRFFQGRRLSANWSILPTLNGVRPDYERAFRTIGLNPLFVEVAKPGKIEKAIAHIAGRRVDALVVRGDPIFTSNREQIGRLAVEYALPTMAQDKRFVEAGMLMSYGPDVKAVGRIWRALIAFFAVQRRAIYRSRSRRSSSS
jgi:hypothetical protein